MNSFPQAPGKNGPPAAILDEVETRLVAVRKTVARIEASPDQSAKDFNDPETAKLFADLRRVLGEL